MTDLVGFPWALNQDVPEGSGYPAESLRSKHYDETSGGNGVGAPEALKVTAQPAPDGTVLVAPGGATVRSTYPGQQGQSFHSWFGTPQTKTVSPTGSSARKDLVAVQICDPEVDTHWDYAGEYPIPAEVAATLAFQRVHVFEGVDRSANLPFPFVKLAEIDRPSHQTIVEPEHIHDLRVLARPKTWLHMRANNLSAADSQSLHTGTSVWPVEATHNVQVPEWATRVHALGNWSNIRAEVTNPIQASVRIFIIHPDGTELSTQESRWRTLAGVSNERFNVVLSDNRPVPAKFRGVTCQVELRGTKLSGPNAYMDGNSSWSLQLYFEQEIS